MARRKRTDTLAGQINAVHDATVKIEPPAHCGFTADELCFFDSIVKARAVDSWNEIDLEDAVQLAWDKAKLAKLRKEVDAEGEVIDGRGNPKLREIDVIAKRVVSYSRKLHVHAEATQGRARDTGERTKRQRELVDSLPSDEEGLLAKRVVQ